MDQHKRILIVTGEASGDLHGAELIHALKSMDPETRFLGVGGRKMAEAGCEILIDGQDLAVMGIVEVLGHFPLIWRSFQQLKKILKSEDKPSVLVLIDFPEFNLRLARQAKKHGVPVLYYVSPQVWAWRRGRVKKIAAIVDSLAAIFPFEPELYAGQDIHVKYVGHPLLDEFATNDNDEDLKQMLNVSEGTKIVGLFPGSRHNELRYMLPTLVETARTIHHEEPNAHFLVPIAPSLSKEQISTAFGENLPVSFVESKQASIYAVASACDAVLTVSGTVTLQVALAGTPMVILYKLAPLSYLIGKQLIRVDHIGLVNIVAGKRVVPEFVQEAAQPRTLADKILLIINDTGYADAIKSDLSAVQNRLGEPGCSERVAQMVMELVESGAT